MPETTITSTTPIFTPTPVSVYDIDHVNQVAEYIDPLGSSPPMKVGKKAKAAAIPEDMARTIPPINGFKGFKFGCDPEFFIREKKTGVFIPAHNFLCGTKEEPFKVDGGAIQVDGLAGEINIDPVTNFGDFQNNITKVMDRVRSMLPESMEIAIVPSAEFKKEIIAETPDMYLALGCSPDYNGWTGNMNPPPDPSHNPNMRCAGGHIHIGWTADRELDDLQHIMHCRDLVQQLDWVLGLWSCRQDTDLNRRKLYGKSGACRIKPYGVEYRVLSNFWLTDPTTMKAMWNRLQAGLKNMKGSFFPQSYPLKYSQWIQKLIDDEASLNSGEIRRIGSELSMPLYTIQGLI